MNAVYIYMYIRVYIYIYIYIYSGVYVNTKHQCISRLYTNVYLATAVPKRGIYLSYRRCYFKRATTH